MLDGCSLDSHGKPPRRRFLVACTLALVLCTWVAHNANDVESDSIAEAVDPDEPANPSAIITAVEPSGGPFHGGNKVTIRGTSLVSGPADVRKILVGGTRVATVLSATSTKIQVVLGHRSTQRHSPGLSDVAVVSRTKGVVAGRSVYSFHAPPRIISVRPDNGPHEGGNEVLLRGRHLCSKAEKCTVLIDGKPSKVLAASKNRIRVRVHRSSTGHTRRHSAHVVVLSQQYGRSHLVRGYTYNPAPVVTHVSPAEGPQRGGNTLRIHGDMITAGQGQSTERVRVKIGGKKAHVVSFSPNSITVVAPAAPAPGLKAIQVYSSSNGKSSKDKAYAYNAQPVISALKPASGKADGNDHVVIHGRNLGKGDIEHIYLGSQKARVLSSSPDGSEVLVQTRRFSTAEEGSTVAVRLKSASFGASTFHGFRVHRRAHISDVQPRDGPCKGGTRITISGDNLRQDGDAYSEMSVLVAGTRARVVGLTKKYVIAETALCPSGATNGRVVLLSRALGRVATPYTIKYRYNALPSVAKLAPEVSSYAGGTPILLKGSRLCKDDCSDLHSIRIGNAVITKFHSKSPRRIIFDAPSASLAGGPGEKNVVVHSSHFGRTLVPRGFLINDISTRGTVHPANVPIDGSQTVTIEGPNLGIKGDAASFGVELAGVTARIVSATPTRIVVTAGNARSSRVWRTEMEHTGLTGDIVVTAQVNGKTYAKDMGLQFRYNPSCSIEGVAARPSARAGQVTVLIAGRNLGFADERITIDGAPATVHRREHRGSNIYRHHVTAPHLGQTIASVELVSRRGGRCVWKQANTVEPLAEKNTQAVAKAPKKEVTTKNPTAPAPAKAVASKVAKGPTSKGAFQPLI